MCADWICNKCPFTLSYGTCAWVHVLPDPLFFVLLLLLLLRLLACLCVCVCVCILRESCATQQVIRRLLDAGALATAADRRGVRACDLATWTAVLHPALMAPLQTRVVQLQQANRKLREHTLTLLSLARNLRVQTQQVDLRAQDTLAHVRAAVAFREHMQLQVVQAQVTTQCLCDDLRSEEPTIARLQQEIHRVQSRCDSAQVDVDECRARTAQTLCERDQVLAVHEVQQQRLQITAHKFTVKCEVIAMARRFADNEALQAQTLRSLRTMCSKPGVCVCK